MQKTLAQQKIETYLTLAQKNESLWNAVLVFLATLLLLTGIPFFPLLASVLLAGICGVIALRYPPIGLILGTSLGFLATIYQSSVLGWFYLLILAIILFSASENWLTIAVLEILIMAPFALKDFPYTGYITILGMAVGALYFGAKRSLYVSLSSVILILLLSSLWQTQNTAYFPANLEFYKSEASKVMITKKATSFSSIAPEIINVITAFLSFENIGRIWDSLGLIFGNLITLILRDTLALQLISWAVVLYLVGYVPGHIKFRPQLAGSLALALIVPAYYLIGKFYGTYGIVVANELYFYVIFSIITLGIFEQVGINISRQSEIERKERMKVYGKFGMADISLGGEERSLDDLGGYEDVKKELRDAIILPLERKEIAYAYGIKPPSGILLFGPPGTGKTMLMRALAKELKYNFIEVKCSQILSQWYSESEKNVAEVFANARKNAPTVLFFDEIDSIAKKRSSDTLDEVTPRVLSTLLQEMDGASKSDKTVMVIGATNVPDKLDPAILRPGRFDKIIYMNLPDAEARQEIFSLYLRQLPLKDDIDLPLLVRKTERFSGADIKNLIVEAKRLAAKEAATKNKIIPISQEQLLKVLEYVKPSTSLSQLEIFEQFRMDFERRVGTSKPKKEESAQAEEVKWTDVVGLDQVKDALLEAIELPLLHEQEMKEYKVKPSKGILLFGPPGTGKTMIVKAAANELKASFQSLSPAELMKKGYTQAVTILKETFDRARENSPAIIFVDEIETFAPARGVQASSEILGQFLTEMDGIKGLKGVVVLAATNKPSFMDPAIMRPGRFDKIFYIPPPNEQSRAGMFKSYLGKFSEGIDLVQIAKITEGYSGADIAAICQAVKMIALRARIAGKAVQITIGIIIEMIKERKPSITPEILSECQRFLEEYGERR